jgi:hypothetical protein
MAKPVKQTSGRMEKVMQNQKKEDHELEDVVEKKELQKNANALEILKTKSMFHAIEYFVLNDLGNIQKIILNQNLAT